MNYKCFILHTFLVLEITVSSNTGTAQEKPLFHVQVQPWAQRLTKEDFVLRVSQKKKKKKIERTQNIKVADSSRITERLRFFFCSFFL